MNTVSVVIPTWNRAPLLKEAIQSALDQSAKPLEVLVCDDGSTDNSEEIVKSFTDPAVKWLPGERSGRSAVPRNRGLFAAAGDWIAMHDSDDTWAPNKLELQLVALETTGLLAACSNASVHLPDGQPAGERRARIAGPFTLDHLCRYGNIVVHSSVVMHRSVIRKTGGYPEDTPLRIIEDYSHWLRMTAFTDFAHVPEPLVRYLVVPPAPGAERYDGWTFSLRAIEAAKEWGIRQGLGPDYFRSLRRARFNAKIRKALEPIEPFARKALARSQFQGRN